MRRSPFLTICLVLLLPAVSGAAGLPDIIPRIKPSIVAVGTYQALRIDQRRPLGTGFVVGDGRHAVTNNHVVPQDLDEDRRETVAVFLPAGPGRLEMRPALVLRRDAAHDLCVLRFEGRPLPALRLASAGSVREGETYAFTGYPILNALGLFPATHRGIVAAVSPSIIPVAAGKDLTPENLKRLAAPFDVYQLDATAYPGNSGSPLYALESGRVVGVINSVFVKKTKEMAITDPSGITYAIPVAHVRDLLQAAKVGF